MNIDTIFVWAAFGVTTIIVVAAVEVGYRIGRFIRHGKLGEKESSVSAIAAATIGLLAFMLAFTFQITTDRYNARKQIVCDEASAIHVAWLQADFLSKADGVKSKKLLQRYVEERLQAAHNFNAEVIRKVWVDSLQIQQQLWDIAMINANKDPGSNTISLYVESLNNVMNLHTQRVNILLQSLPFSIWFVLYGLAILSMMGVGYQTAIAGSRMSWITPTLAFAFSMVITLIVSLDRPMSGFFKVSQQPLENLKLLMIATENQTTADFYKEMTQTKIYKIM